MSCHVLFLRLEPHLLRMFCMVIDYIAFKTCTYFVRKTGEYSKQYYTKDFIAFSVKFLSPVPPYIYRVTWNTDQNINFPIHESCVVQIISSFLQWEDFAPDVQKFLWAVFVWKFWINILFVQLYREWSQNFGSVFSRICLIKVKLHLMFFLSFVQLWLA